MSPPITIHARCPRAAAAAAAAFCLLLAALGAHLVAAQEEPPPATFGDTIQVLGQMARTDQDFVDGLALDLFSPANRTLVVTNNTAPLPGNFVSGSSGEAFFSLSPYSWVVKLNETAKDLIAKIELPYDPAALQAQGVQVANTYVGTLAADGKSWLVSEAQRNVHQSENKTRIIKMTSLDGEYMLLGRKSQDSANIFVQYGQGATRTVNVTGGNLLQEAEFVDGLRFSIQAAQPFTMNVDIPPGVDAAALPPNTRPLNSFAWVVNTTGAAGNAMAVDIKVPFNVDMLAPKYTTHQLVVARRGLTAGQPERFEPTGKQALVRSEGRIKMTGLTQLDGQYLLLVRDNLPQGQRLLRTDGREP